MGSLTFVRSARRFPAKLKLLGCFLHEPPGVLGLRCAGIQAK